MESNGRQSSVCGELMESFVLLAWSAASKCLPASWLAIFNEGSCQIPYIRCFRQMLSYGRVERVLSVTNWQSCQTPRERERTSRKVTTVLPVENLLNSIEHPIAPNCSALAQLGYSSTKSRWLGQVHQLLADSTLFTSINLIKKFNKIV